MEAKYSEFVSTSAVPIIAEAVRSAPKGISQLQPDVLLGQLKPSLRVSLGSRVRGRTPIQEELGLYKVPLDHWGSDLIKQPGSTKNMVSADQLDLDLYLMQTSELANSGNRAEFSEIISNANSFGYGQLVPEACPRLLIQHSQKVGKLMVQLNAEWINIAMQAIDYSVGTPGIFAIRLKDGKLILHGISGYGDTIWPAKQLWLFGKPYKHPKPQEI